MLFQAVLTEHQLFILSALERHCEHRSLETSAIE